MCLIRKSVAHQDYPQQKGKRSINLRLFGIQIKPNRKQEGSYVTMLVQADYKVVRGKSATDRALLMMQQALEAIDTYGADGGIPEDAG